MPDVATADGAAWLRGILLAFIGRRPGVKEDVILHHVEDVTPDDYEGDGPSFRAVDMLAEMEREGALRWGEQKGKPDAPLRYWIVPVGEEPKVLAGVASMLGVGAEKFTGIRS